MLGLRRTSRAGESASGRPDSAPLEPAPSAGSEVPSALDEERAATQRLEEEGKRLSEQLERLERRRSELEGRVAQLAGRVHQLEGTLERERAEVGARVPELEQSLKEAGEEHAREHTYRRQLEERLSSELLGGEELRRELESATGASTTLHQQVERLEQDLSAARGAASIERTAREQLEQIMADASEWEAETHSAAEQEAQPWPLESLEPAAADDAATEGLEEEGAPQGLKAWFRRRRAAAPCAVCQRPPPALSDAELARDGWTLNTEGALCDACQQDGWQFPAGSAAPFRRMGASAG